MFCTLQLSDLFPLDISAGVSDWLSGSCTMEVESVISAEVTATTETVGAAESEIGPVQAAALNDADFGLSSKSIVESDALVDVSGDCAATATVNNNSMTVEFDKQITSLSTALDEGAVESTGPPAGDLGPSTAAVTTSDSSLQRGSSFDSSTQWSSTASVDTVQSVRQVNVPHPACPEVLDNDSSAATTTTVRTTTTDEDAQRQDDKLHSAAEDIEEASPFPSSNSQQQEPQPPQRPESPPKKEDVQVQDFKAG